MPHSTKYSEFTPDSYPPFPESLPTISLETISLCKLLNEDKAEQNRVFNICKAQGFFYLELAGTESGETILHGADEICKVAEDVFHLPMEEMTKYKRTEGQLFGYKEIGVTVVDKNGTKDTAEFFGVSKNDMITTTSSEMSRAWPDAVLNSKPLFNNYIRSCHSTGMMILGTLAEKLGVPAKEIQAYHRINEQSGDHVRLTRGPPRKDKEMPEIQTPSHTDFGTITILMNWLGGLQIWSTSSRRAGKDALEPEPDSPGEWLWVRPRPGYAIVNLGDAAVKFTNGVLCSGRHRVVPAPGDQGTVPRYSVVYFVRPENEVILHQLHGHGIPEGPEDEVPINAMDWIRQQSQALGKQNLYGN